MSSSGASIWNPNARIPATTILRPNNVPNGSNNKPNPEQDAARMAALKRLRHKLVTLCSKPSNNHADGNRNQVKVKPPTLALERWLSRMALERDISSSNTQLINDNDMVSDPLIPSTGEVDPGLVKDLSRCLGGHEAQQVAETMAKDAKTAAERISKIGTDQEAADNDTSKQERWEATRKQLKEYTTGVKKASKSVQKSLKNQSKNAQVNKDDDNDALQSSLTALASATKSLEACRERIHRMNEAESGCNIILDTSRRPAICDVALLQADGTPKKPYLTISLAHLTKFLQLWQFQRPQDDSKDGRDTDGSSFHPPGKLSYKNLLPTIKNMADGSLFLKSLYSCLARYEAIKGAGYQCAVPAIAFDAACDELGLGTTVECFASPFNCRYRNYCSAFPDLEGRFGSLGSFFDDQAFFPIAGSFEANPPFIPEVMWAMNDKLERILTHPKAQALSFLVVVPVWGTAGVGYVEQLEASQFAVAKARIAAADHSFCDGAQHKAPRTDNLRPSSWDTAVVVLQNAAGARSWPIQGEQLERTFCAALRRSAAATTLRDWEQRGVHRGGKQPQQHEAAARPHYTTGQKRAATSAHQQQDRNKQSRF
jgi:hypothetical protein